MIILFLNLAWGSDPDPTVIYKKETSIDFEGLEIEGELLKPMGSVIRERKHAPFNPLIQLRTDFNDELKQSVTEIK
jgi:hypothetical protein